MSLRQILCTITLACSSVVFFSIVDMYILSSPHSRDKFKALFFSFLGNYLLNNTSFALKLSMFFNYVEVSEFPWPLEDSMISSEFHLHSTR